MVKRFAFAPGLAFCFTRGVTPKEHLISCVKALCLTKGGPEAVAEAAGISAENLKQIIAGTVLPSGNPRGVGPKIQANLDAAFPGWANLPMSAAAAADRQPWPLRRITPDQWSQLEPYDRAAMEEAAIAKLKELQAERGQSGGASPDQGQRDQPRSLAA